MRKYIFSVFVLFFIILNIHTSVEAVAPIRMRVNGVMWDVPQVVIDNRILVPARFVAEAMGTAVSWDEESKTVIVGSGAPTPNNTDNIQITVNGKHLSPDVPPRIINNRVMVPIRLVAEALNSRVEWDNKLNTVIITNLKYTTEHATIIPASGVKQSDIDTIKDYAEKAYFKVSSDLGPLKGKFYDIYVYPNHDSFVNGYLEMSELTKAKIEKTDFCFNTPNRMGINLSKCYGPDAGNRLTAIFSWLNAKNIAGDRDTGNKAPEWVFKGLYRYGYYSGRFSSLETMKNLGTERKNALDSYAKGDLPLFSGVLDPVELDYKYGYANYVAAKLLIDRIGFPKIKEILKDLDKESDLPHTFIEKAGCSLEEFDYMVRNALQAELDRKPEPVTIKVNMTKEGCSEETYLVIGTAFAGEEKIYFSEVEGPGEYSFVINHEGTVSSNNASLLEIKPVESVENSSYDVFIAIDYPAQDILEENLVLKINRGLLYPDGKWLIKENRSESEDFSERLDQAFPDGNTITIAPGHKAKLIPGGIVAFQ